MTATANRSNVCDRAGIEEQNEVEKKEGPGAHCLRDKGAPGAERSRRINNRRSDDHGDVHLRGVAVHIPAVVVPLHIDSRRSACVHFGPSGCQ